MKYLIALLILIFIIAIGMSATLIIINLSLNWAVETANKGWDECKDEVVVCNNLETIKKSQERTGSESEYIEIYSEEEINVWDFVPTNPPIIDENGFDLNCINEVSDSFIGIIGEIDFGIEFQKCKVIIEEAFIEPPAELEQIKVCVDWLYIFDKDICRQWTYPL